MGKQLLRFFFIGTIITTLLYGCTAQDDNSHNVNKNSNLTIYVASDLHFLSKSLSDGGAAYQKFADMRDGKEVLYTEQLIDTFIDKIKTDKPDVVVLSGDLTVNGEKKSHEDLSSKLAAIDSNITKVYVIPGNHDINNVYARGFEGEKQVIADYVTQEEFAEIYGDFGIIEAASKDTSSLSYLAKPAPDFWILMIDSNLYDNNIEQGAPSVGGYIDEDTLSWIDKCAKDASSNGATLITVTHQNLFDHNELLNINYTIYNNDELFSVLKENSVRLNFSGHIHCQDIVSQDGIYDVASNALSVYPHKIGILNITDTDMVYDTEKLDVDSWAKAKNLTDPNLLKYSIYTRNRFDETMSQIDISDSEGKYTEEQKSAMTDLFRELNSRFFAGEEMAADEADKLDAYKQLIEQEGFFSYYIKTIASDSGVDDNHLTVKR